MCTTRILDLLRSFEESYDSTKDYQVTKKDGSVFIGKIVDFNKATPGELFNDPDTGKIWDSEEIIVNIFISTISDPAAIKINYRDILDIRPFVEN